MSHFKTAVTSRIMQIGILNQPIMRPFIRSLISIASADITHGFSYFALISIIVLYLSYHAGLSVKEAYSIYGIFMLLAYSTPVIGGVIGDHLLDWRYCVAIGMIMVAAGFIIIGVDKHHMAVGLGIFISGQGLLRPNASSLLGLLYEDDHGHKKDHGYTTVYALMNAGAILGPITIGVLTHVFGFGHGFAICGALLLSMWLIYIAFWHALPTPKQHQQYFFHPVTRFFYFTLALIIICTICIVILEHPYWNHIILGTFITLISCYFIFEMTRYGKQQRHHYIALIILLLFSTIFFATELQVGSSLVTFIQHNLHPYIAIPSSTYASLLAFAVAIGALVIKPITYLISNQKNYVRYQTRCALAMLLATISYLIFYTATYATIGAHYYFVLILVVLGNLFLGFGEVSIAPIITSAVTSLTPPSKNSTFMGVNFMVIGISGYLASILARFSVIESKSHTTQFVYGQTFLIIAGFAATGLILTLLLTPVIKRLVHITPC